MAAQELLHQTNQERESGELLKSLQTADEALIEYTTENNSAGFAETLAARSLTLRHFFQKSGNKNYLYLAKAEMEASVEIARSLDDKTALAIPVFNLAKVYEELEDQQTAIKYFQEAVTAIEHNPPSTHNRPAVVADFKIHLAIAELKNGDTTARSRLESALTDLEKTDEDSYNKNVWLSGAHMSLSNLLKNDDPESSKAHLEKAKEIIDSDQRLILRKAQWEKLAQTLKQ